MSTINPNPAVATPAVVLAPELRAGDHLTRAEFERRCERMPKSIKAELIEGVVYMQAPVSAEHGEPHFDLITWLGTYRAGTPGVKGGDNTTLRLDLENAPQPDAYLRIVPDCGGQSRFKDRDVEGAPELVAEVSSSTSSYDLEEKLNAYRRNGVCEYIVWRIEDHAIDWFVLREGNYEPMTRVSAAYFQSQVFPGLGLDVDAMLRGEIDKVLEVVLQGLQSNDHRQFVARLAEHGKPGN